MAQGDARATACATVSQDPAAGIGKPLPPVHCSGRGRTAVARFRSVVSLLAIVGVLLHAGLLARHNGMMLQATLLHQELATALGVICHGEGGGTQRTATPVDLPAPTGDQSECPICMGMSAAAAVLPAFELPTVTFSGETTRLAMIAEIIRQRLDRLVPPPRGPPEFA